MPKIIRPTKPLADVNVLNAKDKDRDPCKSDDCEVIVCLMPDPDELVGEEESRAVIALDASKSIRKMFGFGGPFGGDPNYVELVSRKLGEILSGITKSGKVALTYWALSPGGVDIEPIGEFNAASYATLDVSGPSKPWGTGTKMLPVIKYIVDDVGKDSAWIMGVIITDGIIEDEDDCMKYCMKLGEDLVAAKKAGKGKEVKLILIGVGEEVDEGQLERFDDMFEGTSLEDDVDIWSSGIAAHMRDESDIIGVLFGELMSEDTHVADSGSVLDERGHEIKSFPDGLPGKFRFVLPRGQTKFTIHTPRAEVTQDISEVLKT